ncbi:MAG: Lrp/AsnC family transcriptional regulator [Halanaerobiaceae bacterium]
MKSGQLDDRDKKIIAQIEEDIPLQVEPYKCLADRLEIDREELIARIQVLKEKGYLKRISALLNHRDAGYRANGMLVCSLSQNEIEQVAGKLITLKHVSHCYTRKSYPEWPFNFYAMIHGHSESEVRQIAENLINKYDICKYRILFSTEEIKKTSMSYNFN